MKRVVIAVLFLAFVVQSAFGRTSSAIGRQGAYRPNSASPTDRALQSDRFTVYVAAPMRDGFFDTSKDIEDSIKDITNRLKGAKEIELVPASDKADVVLTVVARGIGSKAFGERTSVYANYFLNTVTAATVPIVESTYWVSTVMQVGGYKKEFYVGYSNTARASFGAWTRDANDIADDLKVWITANAERVQVARLGDSGTAQPVMVINPNRNTVPEPSNSEPRPVERASTLPADKQTSILSVKRLFVDSFGDDNVSKSLQGWIVNALSDSSRIIVTESHDRADAVLKREVLDNTYAFRLITRDGDLVWSITQQSSINPHETANTVSSKLLSVLSPPPPAPPTPKQPLATLTSTTLPAPAPALVSGTYEGTATNKTRAVSAKMRFQLQEANGAVFGCSTLEKPLAGGGPLRGTHAGSTVVLDHDDKKVLIQFTGTLLGDELKGTFSVQPSKDVGEFTLKRVSANAPLASDAALCAQQ